MSLPLGDPYKPRGLPNATPNGLGPRASAVSIAPPQSLPQVSWPVGAVAPFFSALTLWCYWPTLVAMWGVWIHDPQYSHGYLVPLFAAGLLWVRREHLRGVTWQVNVLGLYFLLAGGVIRLIATELYVDWLEAASLCVCVAGLFALAGGRRVLFWGLPSAAFLLFMIPLPWRVAQALGGPLQTVATNCSLYLMQMAGLPAVAEGNVIFLTRGPINVVEACSGLSMLLIFFALSTAVALLIKRPLLDKLVVLIAALPIAVVANVIRITVTGIAQELCGPELAQTLFHDYGGWLMMPLALVMLAGVLGTLDRVFALRPSVMMRDDSLRPAVPGAIPSRRPAGIS